MLPADDSKWRLASYAGVTGFIGDPIWRIYTKPRDETKLACHQSQVHLLQRKREREQAAIRLNSVGITCWFSDLRTGPPVPWLPFQMRKWSPDRERSPLTLHYAEQGLQDATEEQSKSAVVCDGFLFV